MGSGGTVLVAVGIPLTVVKAGVEVPYGRSKEPAMPGWHIVPRAENPLRGILRSIPRGILRGTLGGTVLLILETLTVLYCTVLYCTGLSHCTVQYLLQSKRGVPRAKGPWLAGLPIMILVLYCREYGT